MASRVAQIASCFLLLGTAAAWAGRDDIDPDYGEGGVALIPSSASAGTFQPEAAALAPNGDMIFVGPLSETGAGQLSSAVTDSSRFRIWTSATARLFSARAAMAASSSGMVTRWWPSMRQATLTRHSAWMAACPSASSHG